MDYIQFLVQQKKKQEEDLEKLRKDVMGLKIMKANYEHIVTAHQNTPQAGQNQVSDEVKFQVVSKIFHTASLSAQVIAQSKILLCVIEAHSCLQSRLFFNSVIFEKELHNSLAMLIPDTSNFLPVKFFNM